MNSDSQPLKSSHESRRPNVILIAADYMGYRDIGPHGARDLATPALDRLANEGVKFTDFYGAAPICSPSRAALLTGCYPDRVGITRNIIGDDGLATKHKTLARYLLDEGYATALYGKWHLGFQRECGPNAHGFADFLGFLAWTISYHSQQTESGEPGLFHNDEQVQRNGYLTEILTAEAVNFVHRSAEAEEPFFLYLAYNTALPPYQPPDMPEESWDRGWEVSEASRQDYIQMVESMDAGIGRVLASLDEQEISDQTLVIFTYDHGGRHLVNSEPLFHGFATLWEGGIRVPMIIRWPDHIPAGHSISQPAISMDITATILDAAGLGHMLPTLDGLSLLTAMRGEAPANDRPLFWRHQNRDKAVRQGPWKYLVDGSSLNTQFLFNLEEDISERTNLFSRYPDIVAELREALQDWETSLAPAGQ